MRKDVVIVQAMAVAFVVSVLVGGSPSHAFTGVGVPSLLLVGPLLLLYGTKGDHIARTIVPRTAGRLWYGSLAEDVPVPEDHPRTADAARCGAWYTRMLGWVLVAHGMIQILLGWIGREVVLQFGGLLLFLPVFYAWLLNVVFWRPLERSATLAADAGVRTRYSPTDAVFPTWARIRDGLTLSFLMLKSAVRGLVIFVAGSSAMGWLLV